MTRSDRITPRESIGTFPHETVGALNPVGSELESLCVFFLVEVGNAALQGGFLAASWRAV